MPSDYVQDGLASATKQPHLLPLPLPLPLPLQPPAFHLQEEEDEVYKQQQEQLRKDRAACGEAHAQEYETSILAKIDNADSVTTSRQLIHKASSYHSRKSSGSGSYIAKKKQRVSSNQPIAFCQVEADNYNSDDFLNPSNLSQIPLASNVH